MKNDLNLKSNQSINHQNSPKQACFDICNDVIFLTHILVVNKPSAMWSTVTCVILIFHLGI